MSHFSYFNTMGGWTIPLRNDKETFWETILLTYNIPFLATIGK